MPIKVYDTFKPQGNYPAVNAVDVEMENGNSLEAEIADIKKELAEGGVPEVPGTEIIEPDKYYVFGEVSALSIKLKEINDDKLHEYVFEFVPDDNFEKIVVTPEIKWAVNPQFVAGKTCQVSILKGIGVMLRA